MTLQRSLGCLRTAAKRLQTVDSMYSRRLSYWEGQALPNMLMSTFVGMLCRFAILMGNDWREHWPSTSIRACDRNGKEVSCTARQTDMAKMRVPLG
jgi:hypothetical protein